MAAKKDDAAPDARKITGREAQRLARLARVPASEIEQTRIADLADALKWRIDPGLLLMRRICGRVVKQDPLTGDLQPVPNATVHVLDTDCSFLGYFPSESPYFWLWPFACSTEELATVTTDECGRFCVWLPYFDVDHYWRWRAERICLPELVKPNLRDLLERLQPEIPPIDPPRPLPDPPRFRHPRPLPDPPRFDPSRIDVERLSQVAGEEVAHRFEEAVTTGGLGASIADAGALLERPAFMKRIAPPLSEDAREHLSDHAEREMAAMAAHSGGQPVELERYVGPFLRCRWVLVPEWTTILDVPDLTFRVTQDVDGDGAEEVIYSEGYFDIRWNSGSIPDVTLVASEAAISTPHCEPVPGIECEDTPSIVTAGYMPLLSSHHDDGDGYAVRVNRPRPPDGRYSTPQSSPGEAPYARTLNLHGCHRIGNPSHYRLVYEFEGASAVPFTGLSWWAPRLGPGAPIHMVPDADGWYPVLPASDLAHPNWLLSWPTNAFGNGTYDVRLELGNLSGGSISVSDQSAPRRFEVDNTKPDVQLLEIRWRLATVPISTPWNDVTSELLTGSCLVLDRPTGADVHLRVIWSAAATHLRNAQLRGGGCGGGLSFLTGEDTRQRWHVGPSDNSVMRTAVMMLPGSHPAGCYSVRVDAWGRQFNPSGFDHGPSANWFINQGAFSWNRVSRAISVVDV